MARLDPHSYADSAQPSIQSLELQLFADFEKRSLRGKVTLMLARPAEGTLDLDTRGLLIDTIQDEKGAPQTFALEAPDPIKGARLRIQTRAHLLVIEYRTSPDATALMWLEPQQTKGKKHPYLFSQCQAIHARSVVPCQDTPRVRFPYRATLNVPKALTPVMAAAQLGKVKDVDDRAIYAFEMPQPIPSYLLAFAVGDLSAKDIGPRTRVWAEPGDLEAAAWEFADVDRHLAVAESLFGKYPWDRFDLLVMPPSFPYGGMENPRLTFLTPALLAHDRSLVNVVAHELAHSWTGNLVTNASMDHFWLNEGFTVYAERRIVEALEGAEAAALQAALGREGLERDLARLVAKDPKLTRLENHLEDVDPDDVYSLVPYEKGYLFLCRLEAAMGRPAFDQFLAAYIERFRFTSIDTSDFVAFLKSKHPELPVDLDEWLHGMGLPKDAPQAHSSRLEKIMALLPNWQKNAAALKALDPTEWQVFLARLPQKLDPDALDALAKFGLATATNLEIRVGYLTLAAAAGYRPMFAAIAETLGSVGRMKYLRPLYTGLIKSGPEGRQLAEQTFEAHKSSYHPVAQMVVGGLFS